MRWLWLALVLAVPAHAERFGVQVGDVPPVVIATPSSWRMGQGRGPNVVPLRVPPVLKAAPGVAGAAPMPPDLPRVKPDGKVPAKRR